MKRMTRYLLPVLLVSLLSACATLKQDLSACREKVQSLEIGALDLEARNSDLETKLMQLQGQLLLGNTELEMAQKRIASYRSIAEKLRSMVD